MKIFPIEPPGGSCPENGDPLTEKKGSGLNPIITPFDSATGFII
jgi:hypothetical protein